VTILDHIVADKKVVVARAKRDIPVSDLEGSPAFSRPTLDLEGSLRAQPLFGLITEIKRSSPSAGQIRSGVDPALMAREYERGGAAGVSVLTDATFFGGSLDDLRAARAATSLPLLRKEFIIDPYQVTEARAHGADAVLLIAAILDRVHLSELFAAATELGLQALVELYDEQEIDILDTDRMTLVGVNNRDLRTFEVRQGHAARVARLLPPRTTVVSESGVRGPADIRDLAAAGIRAALVGEHCMRAPSPGDAVRELLEGAAPR
jgi:indole-3-glycerol phosphate synthase